MFKCFYKARPNAEKNYFSTVNSIEEAANACRSKCDEKDCYDAIIQRRYYMISYGPSMVGVEET